VLHTFFIFASRHDLMMALAVIITSVPTGCGVARASSVFHCQIDAQTPWIIVAGLVSPFILVAVGAGFEVYQFHNGLLQEGAEAPV
jgi:ABC-type dipeptide/oligopeptide/nickel transport system permease subunit